MTLGLEVMKVTLPKIKEYIAQLFLKLVGNSTDFTSNIIYE